MRFVLVNGWSARAALWGEFKDQFGDKHRFDVIDLDRSLELDQWLDVIDRQVNDDDVLLGWSLGGELAIQYAAQTTKQLRALCLFQTNPCFVAREGWSNAMLSNVFNDFDALVNQGDIDTVFKQFAFMMVQGSDQFRRDLKALKSLYQSHADYDLDALKAGMELLRNVDVRVALDNVEVPMLNIFGREDSLVPASLASSPSDIVIDGMAHLPCLSFKEQVFSAMMEFVNSHD